MLSLLTPYERASLYVTDIPKRQGAIEGIIEKYGLDDPIPVQYWYWMVGRKDPDTGEIKGGVLRGDLGWSKVGKDPVIDVIGRRLPATAELALWAAMPMIGIGIWMGVMAAVNHNKFTDQILRVFSITGWSIPTFVFGLLVLMIFYARLGWFPPERLSEWALRVVHSDEFTRYTQMNTVDALLNLRFDIFLDSLRHLVLPVMTLAVPELGLDPARHALLHAGHARQDYMTTARSKGLSERTVIRQTRGAQCPDPGHHRRRPDPDRPVQRRGDHRDGLQLPGHGLLPGRGGPVPGRHLGPGDHPVQQLHPGVRQPGRGRAVRRRRPADPACSRSSSCIDSTSNPLR